MSRSRPFNHLSARNRRVARQLLWLAQDKSCSICGGHIGQTEKCTLDHVYPAWTGRMNKANLLVAHPHCNERKADSYPTPCMELLLGAVNLSLGSAA